MSDFEFFIAVLVIGLSTGSLYSLISLGYNLIYGLLGVINFAHGEFYAVGAYAGYIFYVGFGVAYVWSLIFGALVAGIISSIVSILLYQKVKTENRIQFLVVAIGVSISLRSILLMLFGDGFKSFGTQSKVYSIGAEITSSQVGVFIATIILGVLLWYIVYNTSFGMELRALSNNRLAARAMGVNSRKINSLAFFLGGVYAGAAGILAAQMFEITPSMGIMAGLKAFTASVLGGIGNIKGGVLGGLFIGLTESIIVAYFGSNYKDASVFSVLVISLVFFPKGIMKIGEYK